jgi:Penicillin binding protein transpeptidase domain/Penicillin-binding Protein dimerisation domain/NTF2-like N-terminal transpeptidase domain
MHRRWAPVPLVTVTAAAALLGACSGPGPSPQPVLSQFLAAWSRGDWTAMRSQVAAPPADFRSVNAAAFAALGVTRATFTAAPITTASSGKAATARVTEHFDLPQAGAWNPVTTVRLISRDGAWHVAWTSRAISPALAAGDRLAVTRTWPPRAPVLGAGGAALTQPVSRVVVGVVGSRIASKRAVRADLLAAGATRAQAGQALAQARAHPDYFEPVFTVSAARFARLKAAPGPTNVYAVRGTEFQRSAGQAAITAQLGAQVVGSLGPITAQQLHALGAPYDASSIVGRGGLEAAAERTLAGTPTTRVDVLNAAGHPVTRLATFRGRPGRAVRTSLDPRVQRAAEAALATSRHPDVAMVALRASTGQVLAIVADPASGYDTALQGAYPPGSTFKVLTSTALFRRGLTPRSAASCPPTRTIDGETFHNAEGDAPVSTVAAAFTESCNTAFLGLATAHLSATDFTAVARLYGLQRTPQLGLPAFAANVPAPASPTELAADAMGQGRLTFSPLGMATVAAAIDSGVVRAPRLVAGAPDDRVPASRLPARIAAELRGMMASVVTSGTAAGTGLPAGTHAKTGTAEYGTGPEARLKLDGWLMGYHGDIAFAIVTQNTGGADGGPVDGPIIARFLGALRSGA